jgi:carbon-monoxide dehydrogenase small subunit
MSTSIDFVVNGERQQLQVEPHETLVEVLRERLNLTGTKEGCGVGDCGTCIVLLDGQVVNSCLVLAVDINGREVTTIEGLVGADGLHPLQESFLNKGAFQCGFCTPAMIMSAKGLLDEDPAADEEEIKRALSGVLCRCGSYKKIVEAVKMAREMMRIPQ